MHRFFMLVGVVALVLVGVGAPAFANGDCTGAKTLICHVPPDNPENAQTLCVGTAAVPAHLTHHEGDCVGGVRAR